jgi:hypothetical protein
MVLLTTAAESNWKRWPKILAAVTGLAAFSGFFLFFLAIFATKQGDYPYSPISPIF